MSEVVYEVDISQLDSTLDKVFLEIPEQAREEFLDKIGVVIRGRLGQAIRGLFMGATGGLDASIVVHKGRDYVEVGPTKKVSSSKGVYDLGLILEKGSKGGQVITPINKKKLRFYWKGRWHFRDRVTRGSTPAYFFVRRTRDTLEPEILMRAVTTFREEYEKHKP